MPSCNQKDRDYLVYEFSRQGASDVVPNYFLHKNWDLDTAIGKICSNNFPFPVLQLQADSDPAQPPSIFVDVATQCQHVQLEWVKNASHFDNFDQPAQVADAIDRFFIRQNNNISREAYQYKISLKSSCPPRLTMSFVAQSCRSISLS